VSTATQSMRGVQLLGVNLSGAEDGNPVTGVMNDDYIYPTTSEIDYFASLGLDTIRIPVSWQRLQPTQDGPLDTTQLAQLAKLVAYAASKDITVDIDLHNYGAGYGANVGTALTPDSSFANFWSQMAEYFKGSPNVMFGLMNEPNAQTPAAWAVAAQDAVNAIRATGAMQEILVSGSDWDTASSWISSGNAATVGEITDPLDNVVFEVHQYFNPGSTGTDTAVVSPGIGPQSLAAITQWAEANGKKLFLGEFGGGSDPASLTAIANTVNYLNANANVWQGGTYWAGGPWMSNYMFSADPQNGVEAPQTAVLAAADSTAKTIAVYAATPAITTAATASATPFSGVVITGANAAQLTAATVTLGAPLNGTLSDPNAATDGSIIVNGVWAMSGSSAAVASALDGLIFTPNANEIAAGSAAVTTVTATVKDAAGETASAASTITATAPPILDTIVLNMSEDYADGGAEFTVSVNGQQMGGDVLASALHSSGDGGTVSLTGNWGSGVNDVQVSFINHAYGRNLYVNSISENGTTYAGTSAAFPNNGSHSFAVGGTTPTEAAPTDTVTLQLSGDAWEGDAMFVLYIDGKAVTKPEVVSALHDANQTQPFTFTGNLGAGTHTIGVACTNLTYGPATGEERNLVVNGITLNGASVFGGATALEVTKAIPSFTVVTTH
jgi:aryl-phospho-beta-D-glucosidase BglC (GH1 family)